MLEKIVKIISSFAFPYPHQNLHWSDQFSILQPLHSHNSPSRNTKHPSRDNPLETCSTAPESSPQNCGWSWWQTLINDFKHDKPVEYKITEWSTPVHIPPIIAKARVTRIPRACMPAWYLQSTNQRWVLFCFSQSEASIYPGLQLQSWLLSKLRGNIS